MQESSEPDVKSDKLLQKKITDNKYICPVFHLNVNVGKLLYDLVEKPHMHEETQPGEKRI